MLSGLRNWALSTAPWRCCLTPEFRSGGLSTPGIIREALLKSIRCEARFGQAACVSS